VRLSKPKQPLEVRFAYMLRRLKATKNFYMTLPQQRFFWMQTKANDVHFVFYLLVPQCPFTVISTFEEPCLQNWKIFQTRINFEDSM
jgi:hypothetical protein